MNAILFATAHILRRGDVGDATTRRIAEAAGVSIGSLYQYFPNKEAIFAALRERNSAWYEEELEALRAASGSAKLRDTVRSAIARVVAMHAVDPELHRALEDDRAARKAGEDGRERLEAFLSSTRANRLPDAELAAWIAVRAMVSLIHGTALDAPERLRHPLFVDELTELIVRYLDR